ncbi:SpaA isopeptide-forming pilin-related protein [Amycolatopsis suaedae]|uniref:Prealbumin-like fold domain-containing protein n=1 Tax=Amycolatopsis suaedae TaxID=2510978 RepID=A0A4Q7JBA1_9PSEU|nr:hypothetical protein [Amycolatopsis suaedae]RZQ63524.1 hypothetical protein EWH70_13955 [Amycolatopsis suaedae]
MGRTRHPGRRLLGLIGVSLLGVLSLGTMATPALAAEQNGPGIEIKPGQRWSNSDHNYHLGAYMVGGKQVFCVQFAMDEPDANEKFEPGGDLTTKWGDALSPEVAAKISYLLLRYGNTKDNNEAAALAHLLHKYTATPRNEGDLDDSLPSDKIGYNVGLHEAQLKKAGADGDVARLEKDAEANRGPWKVELTAPKGDQAIGAPGDWTVTVTNAAGKGVADVPIELTLTNATGPDGKEKLTVKTDKDGKATAKVTPSAEDVTVAGKLSVPADKPQVQKAVGKPKTQRVVATGGEKEHKLSGKTKAKGGKVSVTKVDAKTGKGIPSVGLRLTGEDKKSPALGANGKPLVDPEGKPAVLTTGADGVAVAENLKTPQKICIVEATPPHGYNFDPNNPPSACGEVKPGETLALKIDNVPSEVPRTIPAGSEPNVIAQGATTSAPPVAALAAMGVLAAIVSGLVGFVVRRRYGQR